MERLHLLSNDLFPFFWVWSNNNILMVECILHLNLQGWYECVGKDLKICGEAISFWRSWRSLFSVPSQKVVMLFLILLWVALACYLLFAVLCSWSVWSLGSVTWLGACMFSSLWSLEMLWPWACGGVTWTASSTWIIFSKFFARLVTLTALEFGLVHDWQDNIVSLNQVFTIDNLKPLTFLTHNRYPLVLCA